MGICNHFTYSLLGLDGLFSNFKSSVGIYYVARKQTDIVEILIFSNSTIDSMINSKKILVHSFYKNFYCEYKCYFRFETSKDKSQSELLTSPIMKEVSDVVLSMDLRISLFCFN